MGSFFLASFLLISDLSPTPYQTASRSQSLDFPAGRLPEMLSTKQHAPVLKGSKFQSTEQFLLSCRVPEPLIREDFHSTQWTCPAFRVSELPLKEDWVTLLSQTLHFQVLLRVSPPNKD